MTARTRHLLSRGGRPLGLAAVAFARGQRPGEGPWHALAPDLVAAAEEVLEAVSLQRDPAVLGAALGAALGSAAASAAPGWTGALDRAALERIAEAPGLAPPPPAIDRLCTDPVDRALWALALAFCRNPDAAAAVAAALVPEGAGARLVRWSRLAQALARPGEPSRVRRQVRAILSPAEAEDG